MIRSLSRSYSGDEDLGIVDDLRDFDRVLNVQFAKDPLASSEVMCVILLKDATTATEERFLPGSSLNAHATRLETKMIIKTKIKQERIYAHISY